MEKISFNNGRVPALNATNLNKLQDNIEDSIKSQKTLSDTDTYSCNYINSMDKYSTNEVKINKVWIDGKPIYKKVIQITTPNDSQETPVATISNVDTFINLTANVTNTVGAQVYYPYYFNSTVYGQAYFDINTNEIFISNSHSAYQNKTCVIIAEYTKTTD